jgi:hypothetical protein
VPFSLHNNRVNSYLEEYIMSKCIYCMVNKKACKFSNREHVIPQAFGKFSPNNLILNKKNKSTKYVCNTCNAKFGDHIDRWLAKDTYEGYILRNKYLNGMFSPNRKRLSLVVAEGNYKGLHVELTGNIVKPLPQIGLQNHNGTWDYFLLNKIYSIKKENYILAGNCLRAFFLSNDEAKEIFNKIGVNYLQKGILPAPTDKTILCEIESTVDKVVYRAIAKIAFNYFSFFNFKKILLSSNFDNIRKFILIGDINIHIKVDNKPILFDENRYGRLGHIVTLEINDYGKIISKVSLFNQLTFTVFLGESYGLVKLKTEFGHFFDITSKIIIDIQSTSLMIPKTKLIIQKPNLWLPPRS